MLNSDANTTSSDNRLNINQAANIAPNTLTENPDLAQDLNAVERKSSVWLTFVFDEPLTTNDIVQNASGRRVYSLTTSQSGTIPNAGAVQVKRVNDRTLRAKFKDLPEGYRLSDAVGAFVVQGSARAAVGSRGQRREERLRRDVPEHRLAEFQLIRHSRAPTGGASREDRGTEGWRERAAGPAPPIRCPATAGPTGRPGPASAWRGAGGRHATGSPPPPPR